jgi:hypothetical protein
MEELSAEHIQLIEEKLEHSNKENRRLRDIWKKIATELRSFKVNCPFCRGEMRIMGLRKSHTMEGSVADPTKTRITERVFLMFECFECGHLSDFDLDFFSSKHLEKSAEGS